MLALLGAHTLKEVGGVFNGASRGLSSALLEPTAGVFEVLDTVELPDPTYLAACTRRRIVYAASHSVTFGGRPGSGVTAVQILADGTLRALNAIRLDRPHATMLSLDSAGQFLFVACSLGGGIYAIRLNDDGSLGPIVSSMAFPGEVIIEVGETPVPRPVPVPAGSPPSSMTITRMPWYGSSTMPHAIVQTPDRAWLIVADAGAGRIHAVRFFADSGATGQVHSLDLQRQAAPRGLVLGSGGTYAYCVNERESSVSTFRFEAAHGRFDEEQTIPTCPAGWAGANSASGIAISPDETTLWVTNRGHNSVCTFDIAAGGRLENPRWEDCGGKFPMHIGLSPDGEWLCVSNAASRGLAVFRARQPAPQLIALHQIPACCCLLMDGPGVSVTHSPGALV